MTNSDEDSTSWVDGMYQKFEAVFKDAEDATYEDPVKYVEDQVKTAGARVKKFYSVFQDLLSQPPDDSELYGLHLVHYSVNGIFDMPRVATRKRPVKIESEKLCKDSDPSVKSDEGADERPSSGSCDLNNPLEEKACDETNEKNGHDANNSIVSSSSEANSSDEPVNDECASEIPDGTADEAVEGDDAETGEVELDEEFGSMKLDESCVLVDKNEFIPVLHVEAKQRSRKKKLGGVFCLRGWSNGKNQKQLQALQEEKNPPNSEKNINSQRNSLESGWEIV